MSAPQHITALNQANRVRLKRAADRRDIRALPRGEGMAVCADILEQCPDHWANASVFELVTSVKYIERYYCLRLLTHVGLPELKKVGELTDRQRSALAGVLRGGERVAA